MDTATLFENQPFVFLDGAMGTMLQQKGLKAGERTELAALEHPDWLEDIHRAYAEAGSHIIYANTFGANREKLAGTGHAPEEVIAASVECAKRACGGTGALVALDVGPLPRLLQPAGDLTFEEGYALFAEMMEAGERAGADLVVLETMADLQELRCALLAAKEHTGLPVLCTMTFEACGRTFMGTGAASFAMTAEALGASALGVNCSLGPRQLPELIAELRRHTSLPLIAKPNAGLPRKDGGYDITPEEFADSQRALAAAGVRFLGGCCGTAPRYISLLRDALSGLEGPKAAPAVAAALCSESAVFPLPIENRENLHIADDADEEDILDDAMELVDGDTLLCLTGDSPEALAKGVAALRGGVDCPLAVQGTPEAVEHALRLYCGACGVVGAENDAALAAAVKKYGAVSVGSGT